MEQSFVRTMLRVVLGILFLILGFIGLFMPVLQGVLFILIGLSLLGSLWAGKKLAIMKEKLRGYIAEKMKKKVDSE